MNKGTAIVGFFLCFLAGIGVMYGLDRSHGMGAEPEGVASKGGLDHSAHRAGGSVPAGVRTAPVQRREFFPGEQQKVHAGTT